MGDAHEGTITTSQILNPDFGFIIADRALAVLSLDSKTDPTMFITDSFLLQHDVIVGGSGRTSSDLQG